MSQSRTYSWADPAHLASIAAETDGLEFSRLLGLAAGGRTPIFATLDYRLVDVEEGFARYVGEPGGHLRDHTGDIHGGFVATMLDSAAGSAIHSTLPAGTGYLTTGHSVRYLRPVTPITGPVHAVGRVVSHGRHSALATVELRDSSERLLAQASNTCMLLHPVGAGGNLTRR
jgi:uncharacterized protein (TIGR00369 family)